MLHALTFNSADAVMSSPCLTSLRKKQVNDPRTVLAYKFKANADGTIDLVHTLRAAGVLCDGCAAYFLSFARLPACVMGHMTFIPFLVSQAEEHLSRCCQVGASDAG